MKFLTPWMHLTRKYLCMLLVAFLEISWMRSLLQALPKNERPAIDLPPLVKRVSQRNIITGCRLQKIQEFYVWEQHIEYEFLPGFGVCLHLRVSQVWDPKNIKKQFDFRSKSLIWSPWCIFSPTSTRWTKSISLANHPLICTCRNIYIYKYI